MLAKPEEYKGISFVRISSLPIDQKAKIRKSYNRESIVKILKDNTLINDCIIYDDYVKWYNSAERRNSNEIVSNQGVALEAFELIKK